MRMLVSNYIATGEGLTIRIFISSSKTAAYSDLYQKFQTHFGYVFSTGAEEISKEKNPTSWDSYIRYVPELIVQKATVESGCHINWYGQCHINCS